MNRRSKILMSHLPFSITLIIATIITWSIAIENYGMNIAIIIAVIGFIGLIVGNLLAWIHYRNME